MPKPARGNSLGRAIDKEVFQVVTKLLDEGSVPPNPSISDLYDRIQRSNSSLKRRPKLVVEGALERVLSVVQEDSQASDFMEDSSTPQPQETTRSNAMNELLRRNLATSQAPQEGAGPTDQAFSPSKTKRPAGEHLPSRNKKMRAQASAAPPTNVSLLDVGGMEDTIDFFTDNMILPVKWPESYTQLGLKIPHGYLLHGPPGCGKTMFAQALAASTGVPFIQISGPSVVSGMSGESEKQLRQHFENAISLAPCIMFIDEIDTITPKRESAQREMEKRIVGQLLTCMDSLDLTQTNGKAVIVLAATNRPDSIDPALRRAGRFDQEIQFGMPDVPTRERILRAQTRKVQVHPDVDFQVIAKKTPGFVGGDLQSLVTAAGVRCMKRFRDALKASHKSQGEADIPNGLADEDDTMQDDDAQISLAASRFHDFLGIAESHQTPPGFEHHAIAMRDFLEALPHVQPSAKREGFTTVPDVTWDSVGALGHVRKQLESAIVRPVQYPERYKQLGVQMSAGVLLYGPPGCGKTLMAKAVANQSQANFIAVKGPELLNKYLGESEKAVRQMFARASASKPCVIFFDELDALVATRDDKFSDAGSRVIGQFLVELDGQETRDGVHVIAATNRPEALDPAMLRPGRLGTHIYVGVPDKDGLVEILRAVTRKMPVEDLPGVENFVRESCDGYSGADIATLVNAAASLAIDRDRGHLTISDFRHVAGSVRPSILDESKYSKFLRRSLVA